MMVSDNGLGTNLGIVGVNIHIKGGKVVRKTKSADPLPPFFYWVPRFRHPEQYLFFYKKKNKTLDDSSSLCLCMLCDVCRKRFDTCHNTLKRKIERCYEL